MIYLASPYTHATEAVMLARYEAARRFTLEGLRGGIPIFSPIVYGHSMEKEIGTTFEPWAAFNDNMVASCEKFWVLKLPGWELSRGVAHELELAKRLGRIILFFEGDDNGAYHRHNNAG